MQKVDLLSITLLPDWSLSVQISFWVGFAMAALLIGYILRCWCAGGLRWNDLEIEQAEIGTGSGKLKLKPNITDQQVAYAIWVELSTRKIGLPIDFDHDVIAEIYDSWYEFFSITRDLVKSIPVNKVKRDSTTKIIKLSIEILNKGLRPHLTQWQARFRTWYENEVDIAKEKKVVIDPQEIQGKFPQYDELRKDMKRINDHLIKYRELMHRLVLNY